MELVDFISATNAAKSPAEVFGLFATATGDLGLDRTVYAEVTMRPDGEIVPRNIFANHADDRTVSYFLQGCKPCVPATELKGVSDGAIHWEDLPRYLSYTGVAILCIDRGHEAGIHNGVCIPFWGPFGQQSRVGLASSDPAVDVRPNVGTLVLLAFQFKSAYSRLVDSSPSGARRMNLTVREREVLSWCFKGKSSGVIGEILHISESAVNFHIKNAMKKLNCSSRVMCVLKAIRLGLILP